MNITVYQIYCTQNKNQVEEIVCTCLDYNNANFRLRQFESGIFNKKLLTAKPPFFVRKAYIPYNPQARDFFVV